MTNRFKGPDAEENVACNLIPMIDIMFLLLLFFMLGADMTQRELEEVVLPRADQVQAEGEMKQAGEGGRTTVNVFHRHSTSTFTCPAFASGQVCRDLEHWMIAIRANYFTLDTIKDALDFEAKLEPDDAPAVGGLVLSKRHVMIRADENAPYGYIQRVIESCAAVGIYRIEVAAAQPEPAG